MCEVWFFLLNILFCWRSTAKGEKGEEEVKHIFRVLRVRLRLYCSCWVPIYVTTTRWWYYGMLGAFRLLYRVILPLIPEREVHHGYIVGAR